MVWPWLLLIGLLAFGLRFWGLETFPPGFYRDEAYNGLDAQGVLAGEHALYFPANNGREPTFIYLTALSVAVFGPTVWAVRAAAAAVGSLTTYLVFGLGRRWFNPLTGLFAAFLWAVTVWPLHLSRLGLRVILLAPVLAGAAWLATIAWQGGGRDERSGQRAKWVWLAAGLVYSLAFYTYLAGRFTPVLLISTAVLLLLKGQHRQLRTAVFWGGLGILLGLVPLLLAGWSNPEVLLGRPSQVSIFNPQINKGDFWRTLWQHCWRAIGLFVWRGDEIVRHNPPGRPLFDPFIAVPFVIGLLAMIRRWREPAMWLPLLWVAVMVWPTILAEDAPHFLRAAGILPAVFFIPAVGLSVIASWPKLARLWRITLIGILLTGSLSLTVRDYFINYNQLPDTSYLFEAAAKTLVEEVNGQSQQTIIWIDRRYRDGWPSVPFLLDSERRVFWVDPQNDENPLPEEVPPDTLYLWPFDPAGLELVPNALSPPVVVDVGVGPLARGDLEPEPYPLYINYAIDSSSDLPERSPLAIFLSESKSWQFDLVASDVQHLSNQKLAVNLFWSTRSAEPVGTPLTVFVHVFDQSTGKLIGQDDGQPAAGYWDISWLRPGVVVKDQRELVLTTPFDLDQHQIFVGVYPSGQPELRLQMSGQEENLYSSDTVQLQLSQDEP
ncbi:MAG: glycosyltransferase family 39 protein [Ardenticatenaceae bacterium]|nr:glycosyltransferase family 39 protein [Ardenticatenaceae bacterium]